MGKRGAAAAPANKKAASSRPPSYLKGIPLLPASGGRRPASDDVARLDALFEGHGGGIDIVPEDEDLLHDGVFDGDFDLEDEFHPFDPIGWGPLPPGSFGGKLSLPRRIQRGALRWAPQSLGLRARLGFLHPDGAAGSDAGLLDLHFGDMPMTGASASSSSSSSGLRRYAAEAAPSAASSPVAFSPPVPAGAPASSSLQARASQAGAAPSPQLAATSAAAAGRNVDLPSSAISPALKAVPGDPACATQSSSPAPSSLQPPASRAIQSAGAAPISQVPVSLASEAAPELSAGAAPTSQIPSALKPASGPEQFAGAAHTSQIPPVPASASGSKQPTEGAPASQIQTDLSPTAGPQQPAETSATSSIPAALAAAGLKQPEEAVAASHTPRVSAPATGPKQPAGAGPSSVVPAAFASAAEPKQLAGTLPTSQNPSTLAPTICSKQSAEATPPLQNPPTSEQDVRTQPSRSETSSNSAPASTSTITSKSVSSQEGAQLVTSTTAPETAAPDSRSESAAALRTEKVEAARSASIDGDDEVKSEQEEEDEEVDARRQAQKRQMPEVAGKSRKSGEPAKPRPPRFAFEWYRRRQAELRPPDEKEPKLPELVQRWQQLPEEEFSLYVDMADKDRERFDDEYTVWREHRVKLGKTEPSIQDFVDRRRTLLEKSLSRNDVKSRKTPNAAALKKLRPPGYPEAPLTSAYALFCKERAPELRAAAQAEAQLTADQQQPSPACEGSAAPNADSGNQEEASNKASSKGAGMKVLKALREQWRGLSAEAKAAYEERVAEDQERFRSEHEVWRQLQPDEGLVEEAAFEEADRMRGHKRKRGSEPRAPKPPRSKTPRLPRERPPAKDPSAQNMGDVLMGAAYMMVEEQRKRRESVGSEKQQDTTAGRPAEQAAVEGVSGALWGPGDRIEAPDAAPADTSIDDLLGDLAMVEHDQQGEDDEDDFNLFGGLDDAGHEDDAQASAPLLPQVPQAAPQALGAQHLCLDESGNIVLNQSSLSRNDGLDVNDNPLEEGIPVQESVSEYKQAYRRTPPCKWTKEETDSFYEALALYGTDLFLVQTFFRNKSAAQIKSKYTKEVKKNPQLVQEALTTKAQKLTKDTFERLHGKIDTSKHYKPPPSPLPGEERDADGGLPKEDEDDDDMPDFMAPPPEPEYSAEDESLTTNRLMALFD
eukprot:TRINITY_DN6942_c0_g1_i1.p1 TRINITY_DN6942_c0_g1~~TRINITY_DN6942_c0_g1_i1.p1  ORF type:complete len:1184 (-),score=288.18 TRINITY_DN6942_c0_g1_i1:61-3573(-)